MDPLTNPVVILAASFLPLLIAVIKQTGLSPQWNALIALVSYIIAGVAAVAVGNIPFTAEHLTENIVVFTAVGTIIYQLVWRNLGSDDEDVPSFEEKLTKATSINK